MHKAKHQQEVQEEEEDLVGPALPTVPTQQVAIFVM